MNLKLRAFLVICLSVLSVSALGQTVPVWSSEQKVVVVVLENAGYQEALAQPFLKKLASSGVLFSNFRAVSHPSQPNYIAMVAGDTLNALGDGRYNFSDSNIADLLESRGKSWKVYAERFPGNCFTGGSKGKYARKHNPLISFESIHNNPRRCANITDTRSFVSDFKGGRLANYNMYIPDQDNDGHDTNVEFADKYMAQTFGPLLSDVNAMKDVLFIVYFDEDEHFFFGQNQIYSVMYGPHVKPGVVDGAPHDHYSMLRTIEDGFQIGSFWKNDYIAAPLVGFWQ